MIIGSLNHAKGEFSGLLEKIGEKKGRGISEQWLGGLSIKGYGGKAVGDFSVLTDLINPTLSLSTSPPLIIYLFS